MANNKLTGKTENDWCLPLREAYKRLRPPGHSPTGRPYGWLRKVTGLDSGTTLTSIMKGHEPKTIQNLRKVAKVLGLELKITFVPKVAIDQELQLPGLDILGNV